MFSVATRTLDWALAKGPLVRHLRPANSSPSIIMDALDLVSNSRGHAGNGQVIDRTFPAKHVQSIARHSFSLRSFLQLCIP